LSKNSIRSGRKVVTHATVNALIKGSPENTAKLMRLMYRFRDCVRKALPLVRNGVSPRKGKVILRPFSELPLAHARGFPLHRESLPLDHLPVGNHEG